MMKSVSQLKTRNKPSLVSQVKISITNLHLKTYIGFNPEEKTRQQDVIVNAEIRYRADSAFVSDDENDILNYKNIAKRMINHIENGRFQLLEKLTADLLAIASADEQVSYAEVRVDKPHGLRFADSVSVTLSASRQRDCRYET